MAKIAGGSEVDNAYSVAAAHDGGILVAGSSYSNDGDVSGNHGEDDIWAVRLDAGGNIVWEKSLGGSKGDRARSIIEAGNGGIVIAGASESEDGDVSGYHGGSDFWIVKLKPGQ